MLQFRLTVTDPGGLSDTSTVTITVIGGSTNSFGSGSGGGVIDPLIAALLLLAALVSAARGPSAANSGTMIVARYRRRLDSQRLPIAKS
jgi:hypothetical protein